MCEETLDEDGAEAGDEGETEQVVGFRGNGGIHIDGERNGGRLAGEEGTGGNSEVRSRLDRQERFAEGCCPT